MRREPLSETTALALQTLLSIEQREALLELGSLAHLPLIALTGYCQPRHQQQAKACGFDHFCVKPVRYSVLLALLENLADAVAAATGRPPERFQTEN